MEKFDLDMNNISYEWVETTNDPKLLKKALTMLKEDGGYFPDLENTIDEKLQQIDKKYRQAKLSLGVSSEDVDKAHHMINNWEKEIKKNDQIINQNKDTSSNAQGQAYEIRSLEGRKMAENEKIKGNESMKTKEYDAAIRYYTRSIDIDPFEPTTFCNRALAYINMKQFTRGYDDCDKAISLKKDYIKAYYRRAVCLNGMRKFKEGLRDFLYVLNDNPQSDDLVDEITKLRGVWKKDVGEENWKKVEEEFDSQVLLARKGQWQDNSVMEESTTGGKKVMIEEESIPIEQTQTQEKRGEYRKVVIEEDNGEDQPIITEETKEKTGFKKITIEEDDEDEDEEREESKTKQKEEGSAIKVETVEDIPEELKQKYNRFIESGEEVKKELKRKMDKKEYKASEAIAHNCYLDCEKYIKKFKSDSIYFNKIDTAMKELKSLLTVIRREMSKEPSDTKPHSKDTNPQSQPIQPTQSDTKEKLNNTTILSQDQRTKATQIAEQAINFTDFPKSSIGFEKAYSSFKSKPEIFYEFLKYINGKSLTQIYKNTEIPNPILVAIIKSLSLRLDPLPSRTEIILDYLTAISTTKSFSLIKNFLKATDKESIKSLLNEISSSDESKSSICDNLIKTYC